MKASILAIMLMVSCVGLADTWTDTETGRTWSYRMIGDTAEIIQGEEYQDWSGDLIIPDKLGDIVVSRIGDSAFSYCYELSGELIIPNGVRSIGKDAFLGCSGLSGELAFPNSVTNIDYDAFWGCGCLTSVRLPDSLIDIGYFVFGACEKLETVYLPDRIGDFAEQDIFSSCPMLREIQVNESNPYFENVDGVLYDKTMETLVFVPRNSVIFEITNSVKTVARYAFRDCEVLDDVVIPSSVTRIEVQAFLNSKIIDEVSSGPIIRNGCLLEYNGQLPASISLNNVRLVAEGVFVGRNSLESVTLSEGAEIINDWNFYGCRVLRSITVPASLKSVGFNFLNDCPMLQSINVAHGNQALSMSGGILFNKCEVQKQMQDSLAFSP